jgi:hypothetical protein
MVAPATIETTNADDLTEPRRSAMTWSSRCGLTASTTTSASLTAAALSVSVRIAWRSPSSSTRAALGPEATIDADETTF